MNQQSITVCKGVVRRWHGTYGFIKSGDIDGDVFVHFQAIDGVGYRNLYEGDRVNFTAVLTDKGWQARSVRVFK